MATFLAASSLVLLNVWIAARSTYENRLSVLDARAGTDLQFASSLLHDHLEDAHLDVLLLAELIRGTAFDPTSGDPLPSAVAAYMQNLLDARPSYLTFSMVDAVGEEVISVSRDPVLLAQRIRPTQLTSLLGSVAGETGNARTGAVTAFREPRRNEDGVEHQGPFMAVSRRAHGLDGYSVMLVLDVGPILEHVFATLHNSNALSTALIVTREGLVLSSPDPGGTWSDVARSLGDDATRELIVHLRETPLASNGMATVPGVGRVHAISITPSFLIPTSSSSASDDTEGALALWTLVSYVPGGALQTLARLRDPSSAVLVGTIRFLGVGVTVTLAILSVLVAVTSVRLRATYKRFEHDARFDPVTGLHNRRACEEDLQAILLERHGKARSFSLALIDVDHFKSVNDRFGHFTGDVVLRTIARIMQATLGRTSKVFRLGGDEFLALLPDISLPNAVSIVDDVRQAIAAHAIELDDGVPLSVTISAGVTTYSSPSDTVSTLLKAADVALYRAKDAGRNCVRTSDPPSTDL